MLVLSRQTQQQVVFPQLGIKVKILQVRGKIVKLGIDAPGEYQILRNELAPDASPPSASNEAEHRRRNELNLLQLKLTAIQRRIERGESVDADVTLQHLLQRYSEIDHELDPAVEGLPAAGATRPIRLLVVEDCDNERRLMAYVLASHGFDVHVARDGSEALRQMKSGPTLPDCVLMDMQMPLSGGLETLLRIRQDERLADLVVLAVTGSKRSPDDEPAGRGWDGWFPKPLDVPRLISRLSEFEAADRLQIAN